MKYLVGINVRLKGVDCLLIDEQGKILRTETEPYALVDAGQGQREQNPGDWWQACVTALKSMLAGFETTDIAAVGITGEMDGLVALDSENNVIRNAILWNDPRGEQEYNEIIAKAGVDALLNKKHPVESKLYWMQQNEPDAYARIAKFVMPMDYVRFLLTGNVATDSELAAHSGYFSTEEQDWDNAIISNIGFDIVVFPPIAAANAPAGIVTEEAAQATQLPAGIPVYSAGAETAMRNACLSMIDERAVAVMLGTSGVVAAQTDKIPSVAGGRLQTLSLNNGEAYAVYGRELACGDALQWAEEALFGLADDPELALYGAAENAAPGSDGILFLPYLLGEQSPHVDPDAKAVFYGMTMVTGAPQLARAVMDGVVFELREIYDVLLHENHEIKPNEIIVSGSASGSTLLKHIIADVFGLPVKVYQGGLEGAAYGAALTAGVGEGFFKTFDDAEKLHHIAEIIEPDTGTSAQYTECLKAFEKLHKDLHRFF